MAAPSERRRPREVEIAPSTTWYVVAVGVGRNDRKGRLVTQKSELACTLEAAELVRSVDGWTKGGSPAQLYFFPGSGSSLLRKRPNPMSPLSASRLDEAQGGLPRGARTGLKLRSAQGVPQGHHQAKGSRLWPSTPTWYSRRPLQRQHHRRCRRSHRGLLGRW